MIDIHTHILPNIDDGSDSVELSIKQLRIMAEAGVTSVVFTPHFYKGIYNNNSQTISFALNKLKTEMLNQDFEMELVTGAECYLINDLYKNVQQENLNIENTKFVLVETSLAAINFDQLIYQEFFKLLKKGYKPIFAHPERYHQIINDPEFVREIIFKDVYIQVNAGSLFGYYGKDVEKAAWYLVENGLVHFVASDNHCIDEEYPLLAAKQIIAEKIDDFTANLLFEVNPKKMLNNQKIEYFYVDEVFKSETFFQKFIKRVFSK
ncbi:MAG: CpsB/CapC family capsule biosynthesis tyrosine phosphatase [Candidatus Cloacimonadota bacterium]|nr:CpsB/CapC family capsule biosynthesis tyrosine phosphatase [Candidatus Cloacimonadota bacterium]